MEYYEGFHVIEENGSILASYVGADYTQIHDMANSIGLYDMAGNVAEWCMD